MSYNAIHTSKAWLMMAGLAGLAFGASGLVHSPVTAPDPAINHGVAQFRPMHLPVHAVFAKGTTPRQMVDAYKKLLAEFGPGAFEHMIGGAGLEFNFNGVRWPGAYNTPFDLTYSFPPDGVSTGNGGPNVLHQIMNNSVGPDSVWMADFATALNEWSQVAGLSYTLVGDDGAPWPDSPGSGTTRGDIRIVAGNIDGPGHVLAFNFFPNHGGDMFLNSAENWGSDYGGTDLFLRNVVTHENGHGIGLSHTCPQNGAKLMEPGINVNFVGPQFDDILAAQYSYGDLLEPNDSLGAATVLEGQGLKSDTPLTLSRLSLRDPNDIDVFSFQDNSGAVVNQILALPQGYTYPSGPQNQDHSCASGAPFDAMNQLDIVLDLLDSTGQVIATSNSGGLGAYEVINNFTLPANGTYFVRVRSTGGTQSGTPIQRYVFTIHVTLTPPTADMILTGAAAGDEFGFSVTGGGEVNFNDFAVGAPGAFESAGQVNIYSGATGAILHTLTGYSEPGFLFGSDISINPSSNPADDNARMIIGEPGYGWGNNRRNGFAYYFNHWYQYSGSIQGPIYTNWGAPYSSDDQFGTSVAILETHGPKIIVGAPYHNTGFYYYNMMVGRVYVYDIYWGDDLLYTFTGEGMYSLFGSSVADAGDVDSDGTRDIIVGAPGWSGSIGRAYVYSLDTGARLYTFTGEAAGDTFGNSVAGAGDVNGDGFDDLIVGASDNDAGGSDAGQAYIYSGHTGTILYTFTGEAPGDWFGSSVASAGDVNGDSVPDVIIGAPGNDAGGADAGRAYVYSGATGAILQTFTGEVSDDRFGYSVAGAGDVNGDGFPDVIVGAPFNDAGGANAGRAYVFFSRTFQPPTIESLTAVPNPIVQGDTLTLACFGVFDPEASNGMPAVVEFYRDVNGDGVLQPASDQLLGVDSDWTNGWVLLTSTASFSPGVNTFFARARSSVAAALWSVPVSGAVTVESPCADLNGDGVVNAADLALMLGMWGTGGIADVNGDGVVDVADLETLLSNWGACP